MKHGGAWVGFHFAGYNDESTHWPWFVSDFLDAVFLTNSWPPLPATLVVEDRTAPSRAAFRRRLSRRPMSGTSGSQIRARTKIFMYC